MNKVIQVLAQMASDASIKNEENLTTMLTDVDITKRQKQAIEAKDLDTLTETIHDLPIIKCVPIIPAEDDEQEENDNEEGNGGDAKVTLAIAFNC